MVDDNGSDSGGGDGSDDVEVGLVVVVRLVITIIKIIA